MQLFPPLPLNVKSPLCAYNKAEGQSSRETPERSVTLWHMIYRIAVQALRKTADVKAAGRFCAGSSIVRAIAPAAMKTAAAANIPAPAATRSGRNLPTRAAFAVQTCTAAAIAAA